jgi:hypothetical protein
VNAGTIDLAAMDRSQVFDLWMRLGREVKDMLDGPHLGPETESRASLRRVSRFAMAEASRLADRDARVAHYLERIAVALVWLPGLRDAEDRR